MTGVQTCALPIYQEALMSIEELRERMPALRQREQALRNELQAIADQANERAVLFPTQCTN